MTRATEPVERTPKARLYDPARDAARLLGWFGFAVLMVGAPLIGVLSRRALVVLLPVGAAILAAGYLLSVSRSGLQAFGRALASPIGTAALFVAGWAALSLVWTPFPELAAPRLLGSAATVLVAALVVAHIPERRATRTLYLLPGGLVLTSIATAGLALAGPASFRGGTEFDPSLIERSALTLTVLVWPALGALATFGRSGLAIGLAVVVVAGLAAASAPIALAAFAFGATAFAIAMDAPRGVARVAAAGFVALMVVAPALPFVLAPLARAVPMVGQATVAAMTDWRDLVIGAPLRLITGHGLDSAREGVILGFLPPHTPRSVLFEAWYDLGVLGVLAIAAVFALGLLAAGEAAPLVAPAVLGSVVSVLAVAVFGVATAELWFVTLVSLCGVALGLLARSGRSTRPSLRGTPDETDL